jgi:hypothetical protein
MISYFHISCWLNVLCTTEPPGHPFGDLELSIFDTFRLLVLVLCVINLILSAMFYDRFTATGQRNRVLSGILWTLQTLTTESIHLGDQATMRLIVNGLATVAFFYGLWQVRAADRATKPIES